MSDETRRPAPDGGQSAPRGQDDALDSWFRPRTPNPEQAAAQVQASAGPNADAVSAEPSAQSPEAADESVSEANPAEQEQEHASEAPAQPDHTGTAEQAAPAEHGEQAQEAAQQALPEAEQADEVAQPEQPEEARLEQTAEVARPQDAGQPAEAERAGPEEPSAAPDDQTQVMPAVAAKPPTPKSPTAEPSSGADSPDNELTQVFTATPAVQSSMAVRPSAARTEPINPPPARPEPRRGDEPAWRPMPDPRQDQQPSQEQKRQSREQYRQSMAERPHQSPPQPYEAQPTGRQTQPYQRPRPPFEAPGGQASILPVRGYDEYDDFDNYSYADPDGRRRGARARRALLATTGVLALVVAVVAVLTFTGKVTVFGIGAKPVPTVGFSPSGSDAGSYATQTGTAFLTAWQNGNLTTAANITDDQSAALAALTAYKRDLKVSGLTLMPGTASAQGWMTFSVTAQVGAPASAWSYSSGLATYSTQVDGYTRWFVKWQPSVMFTSLKSGQKLALGTIPPTADKVVDSTGAEITGANAPSLNGIVGALKKAAPPTDGTPGQEVRIYNADGSVAAKVDKVSDPVSTSAVKTTIDLHVQAAAQAAVNQAPNSSMVVIQPSTGNILAVANNPPNGLDTAMVGHYAPGSTFKTITTALVLNKGVISDLNQTWDCPLTLKADGITLHNSEQESGVGDSFLKDFAQSCNNAFSRFGSEGKVSRDDLVSTAHDYFGFNQKWDVGLNSPTTYGYVPNSSSNSLAEELVGQDQIEASPLAMASVAATIAQGSFKQPILVPGTRQLSVTALSSSTDQRLKTLMRQVVLDGTLAGILPRDVYAKTGTAEVQGKKPNSWTIAFRGDYAVAALAVGGNFGAQTAGPEVRSLLDAVK